jgi:N-carbamoylputrescine amidase
MSSTSLRSVRKRRSTIVAVRVTIVELPDDEHAFDDAWSKLCAQTTALSSDVVVLNEVPFAAWFAMTPRFDAAVWRRAVDAHERWQHRLAELGAGAVIYTAPTGDHDRRNTGLLWTSDGITRLRDKALLPDEDPTWEATWYGAGRDAAAVFDAGSASAALVICSELWAPCWASDLGRAGVHLIATPRATGVASLDNWFAAGRVTALTAGAYSVSSNRAGNGFGGGGWVFGPSGELLGQTSEREPFVTVDIDLDAADAAKATYPRYVIWAAQAPS